MSAFEWDTCQLTYSGIQYNELHEGYQVNLARDRASTAIRRLSCAWGDADELAKALTGSTLSINGQVIYTAAASHPLFSYLQVESVNIQPVGESLGTGIWEQAHLTVSYAIPEFGDGSSDEEELLKEESIDVTAFNQRIPTQKLQFPAGSELDEDAYTTVRVLEYRVVLYRQPTLPLPAITQAVNKVNNATWKGLPAGQALYAGAEASRRITSEGTEEWTISHVVLIGERDHRMRYNIDNSAYEIVKYKDGSNIIDETNFALLGI